jgi:hypothetical protein
MRNPNTLLVKPLLPPFPAHLPLTCTAGRRIRLACGGV